MTEENYAVWCPERGDNGPDDGRTFKATDHEDAAERWAERSDWGGDYDIVAQRSSPTVSVQGPDGKVLKFKVSGEAVPSYRAEIVE